jgi:predicted Fe-S protein YdhL (DUF1289 family)
MYAMMVVAALSAPANCGAGCAAGWGEGGWGMGVYQHGYGSLLPIVPCPGVVLPPDWPCDSTTDRERQYWFEYVELLEGHEKEDAIRLWTKATPEARRLLLAKVQGVALAAAEYRAKVARERAIERYKEENRPLTDEELAAWEAHIDRLEGDKRKSAIQAWKEADNRGRRLILRDLVKRGDEGREKPKDEKQPKDEKPKDEKPKDEKPKDEPEID